MLKTRHALMLAAVLLGGCDEGTPSEEMQRKAVLGARLDQTVVIEGFHQSEALSERPRPGLETYLVKYEAKLRWPEGRNPDCLRISWNYNRCRFLEKSDIVAENGVTVEHGRLVFVRTDGDWRLDFAVNDSTETGRKVLAFGDAFSTQVKTGLR